LSKEKRPTFWKGEPIKELRAEPHYIIIGLMKTPRRKHGQVKTLLKN